MATWGGAREGAGRPQQRIHLNAETARLLREVVRLWREETPEAQYTPARVVEDLIYREVMARVGEPESPDRARWLQVAEGEALRSEPGREPEE